MDTPAPLVTFALLCFNQQQFIVEAINSALGQDYSPLEILISDDASTDATWEIIQRETASYTGPHKIRLYRNSKNLSCTVHTLSALALASADLVIFGAGDDISEPDRVSRIASAAIEQPSALSFWSDMTIIDAAGADHGVIPGFRGANTTAYGMAVDGSAPVGASQAYRKIVGEYFGAVDPRAASEDLVLHFRSALLGTVAHVPGPLVKWRRHSGSMESIGPLNREVDAAAFKQAVLKINEQRLFCYRARAADLQILLVKDPARKAEIVALLQSTNRLIDRFETIAKIASGNLLQGIYLAVRMLIREGRLMDVLRNFATLRFPGLWRTYVRWRAGA